VLAFDVAVGAGRSVDDLDFYAYLCRVADWRLDWGRIDAGGREEVQAAANSPDEVVLDFYSNEEPEFKRLIDATAVYRSSRVVKYDRGGKPVGEGGGILPKAVQNAVLPDLVVSQTISMQK